MYEETYSPYVSTTFPLLQGQVEGAELARSYVPGHRVCEVLHLGGISPHVCGPN